MKLNWKKILKNTLISVLIPLVIFVAFAILTNGRTASLRMVRTTLKQCIMPTIICWGMMLSMSVGMINFSAGAMMLCASIIAGGIVKSFGLGSTWLLVLCVLVTIFTGAVNGLLYNKLRVPSMILTIGMLLVWEAFPRLFFPNGVVLSTDITIFSRTPTCYIILGVCFVFFHVLYNNTTFGHNLNAIGNNLAVSNSVGLNIDKIKFLSFLLGAVFLGLAAALYASDNTELRNVSAMSSMTIMMDGFMGMFMAMFLAKYSNMSIAVVIGTFSMKFLSNGFVAMGLPSTAKDVVQGLILLVLLTISANAGLFERRKANKAYAAEARSELAY